MAMPYFDIIGTPIETMQYKAMPAFTPFQLFTRTAQLYTCDMQQGSLPSLFKV
jgi:hypothetical protein